MGGYPWYLAAHPLIEFPALVTPAVYLDDTGMGLLVAIFGASLLSFIRRDWLDGTIGFVCIGLAYLGATFVRTAPPTGTVRVGLVQTNLETTRRMGWEPAARIDDFVTFLEASTEATRAGAEMIIWPETMHPGETLGRDDLQVERDARLVWKVVRGSESEWVTSTLVTDSLLEYQGRLGIPMVIGNDGFDDLRMDIDDDGTPQRSWSGHYNSVFVVEGGAAPTARYDKVHLTPFGETMPIISRFDGLERALLSVGAQGMQFDLDAGREARSLPVGLKEREIR
ncbi:MAG: hypothetical protein KDA28_09120, partial [Phycisphaerales bacterium]|nr:hypothetical protein [Phycisphaerales bacterium]